MPHDMNDRLLQVGDRVTVEFEVVSISTAEEYCNCNIATVIPMYPGESKVQLWVNTRQVELVAPVPVEETANA